MITSTLITGSLTVPQVAFTSSTTGGNLGGSVLPQMSAITTIILCNIKNPDITDETQDAALVNVHLVKSGQSYQNSNRIVSRLLVPAGETVFFNDERIILDGGDQIWVGTDNSEAVAVTVSSLPV